MKCIYKVETGEIVMYCDDDSYKENTPDCCSVVDSPAALPPNKYHVVGIYVVKK